MPTHEDVIAHPATLPNYDRPPITEVVCGMTFQPIDGFRVHHVGQLWEKFKPDYRQVEEAPPLPRVIEDLKQPAPSVVQFELGSIPPLPRIWFTHNNGTSVIQVQRDRFLYNWRKIQPGQAYPRYGKVIQGFLSRLDRFEAFLITQGLGSPVPLQYEMTYVNQIARTETVESLANIGVLLPDFAWRGGPRVLPEPEGFDWATTFVLPDESGRLHVRARTAKALDRDETFVILELTARGMPGSQSREAMREWFDSAHVLIVTAFADLTGEESQRTWGKR